MIINHETLLSSSCKINIHSKRKAYFEGYALSLREVLTFWKVRNDDAITALERKPDLEIPKHGMFLDYSQHYDFADLSNEWPLDISKTDDNGSMIVETRRDKLEQASEREQAAGRTLISQYGEDAISVLYLGRTQYVEKMDIALLIVKEKSIWTTNLPWQRTLRKRIGICFLPSTELEICVENGAAFTLLKGIFEVELLGGGT